MAAVRAGAGGSERAEVSEASTALDGYRVGLGTDLHRLGEGRALRIGGVGIPSPRGAEGHSDADVLLHAIADALLGAVAAGDIGLLFPDTDPRHRGLDSARIVVAALEEVARRGFHLVNVDTVVELQAPQLAPHREAIRSRIAALLDLPVERVSFKAKTGEGLGDIGRGHAIAAHAVALVAAGNGGHLA